MKRNLILIIGIIITILFLSGCISEGPVKTINGVIIDVDVSGPAGAPSIFVGFDNGKYIQNVRENYYGKLVQYLNRNVEVKYQYDGHYRTDIISIVEK
jgi:hypothetical protein